MQTAAPQPVVTDRVHRLAPFAVFLVGLGLTGCFYAVVTLPSLRDSLAFRYFCGHPIEGWTAWLFFWGMAALGWKGWRLLLERAVLIQPPVSLPPGRLVGVAEIPKLIGTLSQASSRTRKTWLVRRLADSLNYVQQHGSAEGLEERLEVLADRDANELDGSYELVRTVTWAIPILGFLGTVIGITIAIANITPDQLQDSLNEVVGGLAVAFDTTALALALSMAIVLAKFMVERVERAVLTRVDAATEDALLHRFEKYPPETQAFLHALEGASNVIMKTTRDAWREQGQLWTRAVEHVGESLIAGLQNSAQKIFERTGQVGHELAAEQSFQFGEVLKRMEKMHEASAAAVNGLREIGREWIDCSREDADHRAVSIQTQLAQFLDGLDALHHEFRHSLTDVAAKLTAHQAAVKRQVELISQLVADEGRLSKLQRLLSNNLERLTSGHSLETAIQNLTNAGHLLAAQANRKGGGTWFSRPDDDAMEEAA